jgi:hypothetical protein
MPDIAQFRGRIIEAEDALLFDEAINSATSSAVRAAYIMVWLSCAESLKRRFRVAKTRDGAAKRICGEIERREKAHQSVDVYLLDEAKDYGFLSDTEHLQLKHIYEMRCVYGHPYEKAPSDQELVAAAECVVEIVLSKPVRLRHGFLDNQAKLLTQNSTYLDDDHSAVCEYSKEIISRADPSLLEWWCEKILTGMETIKADPNLGVMVKRGYWVVENVLKSLSSSDLAGWNIEQLLLSFPDFAPRLLALPTVFPHLSQQQQDMIIGALLEAADARPAGLGRIQTLDQNSCLNARQRTRFKESVADVKLESLSKAGLELRMYWARLVEDLKSHNWYVQNPAIKALRQAGPTQVASLEEPEQLLLGNNVLQAADGGSKEARELAEALVKESKEWPRAFIHGLIAECFVNDDGHVRFKCDELREACLAFLERSKRDQKAIVSDLSARISDGTPKHVWSWQDEKDWVFATFTELEDKDAHHSLQVIREAIESVKLPKPSKRRGIASAQGEDEE